MACHFFICSSSSIRYYISGEFGKSQERSQIHWDLWLVLWPCGLVAWWPVLWSCVRLPRLSKSECFTSAKLWFVKKEAPWCKQNCGFLYITS